MVRFDAVAKRFGEGPLVLNGLNFEVRPRDFVTLIGPSGCGKSTILKLIAGLSLISRGQIEVDGMAPEKAAGELAYVFQDPTLLPWLTAQRNVEIPLKLRGAGARERAEIAGQCLALVRLGHRREAYPRQLSGGQKMRVSLARALSISPKIMLLDEPFGALDEMTRNHLNEELLAIREQEAWTAFFVTHSVAEAVFLSNRIFVLSSNPGQIHREVRVDLPYPRTADTRHSADYQHLVADVSRLLRSVDPE